MWPFSAVGRVNRTTRSDERGFCTGTLVAPNLVLTAAHCLYQDEGVRSVIHFVTAVANGVPAEHAIAKRVVISPQYVPHQPFRVETVQNDWDIIVLNEALATKPVPVRSLTLAQVEKAGPFMHVGYGKDRPFLPSVVRDCWVGGLDEQTLMYRCLTIPVSLEPDSDASWRDLCGDRHWFGFEMNASGLCLLGHAI